MASTASTGSVSVPVWAGPSASWAVICRSGLSGPVLSGSPEKRRPGSAPSPDHGSPSGPPPRENTMAPGQQGASSFGSFSEECRCGEQCCLQSAVQWAHYGPGG